MPWIHWRLEGDQHPPQNPQKSPSKTVASVGSLKLLKPKLAAASGSSPISFPGSVSLKPPECNPCSPCGSIFKLLDVGFTIGLVNPIVDVEDVEDVVVNPSSTNFAARVVGFVCFDILGGSVASVASAASVNFVALVFRDRDMLGPRDVTTRGLLIKCCQKNVLGFQGKVGEVYFMTPRHDGFGGCSQENFSEASWKMFGEASSWESKMNIVLLHCCIISPQMNPNNHPESPRILMVPFQRFLGLLFAVFLPNRKPSKSSNKRKSQNTTCPPKKGFEHGPLDILQVQTFGRHNLFTKFLCDVTSWVHPRRTFNLMLLGIPIPQRNKSFQQEAAEARDTAPFSSTTPWSSAPR